MKRLLVLLMVFICISFSSFSYSFELSIESGISFEQQSLKDGIILDWQSLSIPISFDTAFYFHDNWGFCAGMEFLSFPLVAKLYDSAVILDDMKISSFLYPYIGLAYKYDFSNSLGISFMLGSSIKSRKLYSNGEDSAVNTEIDIIGDFSFRWEIIDSLLLQIGTKCAVPIWANAVISNDDNSSVLIKGCDITAYIGVGYKLGN